MISFSFYWQDKSSFFPFQHMKSWLIVCSIYQATFCKIHILEKRKKVFSIQPWKSLLKNSHPEEKQHDTGCQENDRDGPSGFGGFFSLLLFLLCQKFRRQKLTLSSVSNCASHTSRAITLKGHTGLACLPAFLEVWEIQAQVPGNGYFFFLFNTIVKFKFSQHHSLPFHSAFWHDLV